MGIKITDNLMTRPLMPGSGVNGLNVAPERIFGNRVANPAGSPDVPRGFAGPQNNATGEDWNAASRAAGAIAQSLTDTASYFENLKIAEEDSRGQAATYDVLEKEQAIRKALGEQAALENWSNDQYKTKYEEAVSTTRDEVFTNLGLSHPKVISHYDQAWKRQRFELMTKFDETVIKPRAVAQVQANTEKAGNAIIATAVSDGSVDAGNRAAAAAAEYASSPAVVAVLGPERAQQLGASIVERTSFALVSKKADELTDLQRGPLASVGADEINDLARLNDAKGQLNFYIDNLPGIDADKRETLRSKYGEMLDRSFSAQQKSYAQATKERVAAEQKAHKYAVDMEDVRLGGLAAERKLSYSQLESTVNKLLKDPAISSDPDAILAVGKMRNRYLDDVRRQHEEAARDSAARSVGILPTDKKSVDRAWSDFSKGQLAGKPLRELPQAELEKVGAWLRDVRPLKLPTEIDSTISYGLLSRDKAEFNRAYVVYNQIKQQSPHLLGDLDKRSLDMAERVASGQTHEAAFTAATRQAPLSDDEKKAARTIVSKEAEKWKTVEEHPLAKALDVKHMTPSALAAYQREFEDNVLGGLSPEAASKAAVSTVARQTGASGVMTFDGKTTVALNAPEKLFGVPTQVLRNDVIKDGKSFGLTKDSKWMLQPTGEKTPDGRPVFGVLVQDNNGGVSFAQNEKGQRFKYSFDPKSSDDVQRAVEQKRHQDTVTRYNELYVEGVRSGAIKQETRRGSIPRTMDDGVPKPLSDIGLLPRDIQNLEAASKHPGFRSEIWAEAVKRINEGR